MKKIFCLSVLIIFSLSFISIVGCNNQKSTKEKESISEKHLKDDYTLQEKCGKRSEEWMKSYKQKFTREEFTYENHFNKKLNKCFIYKSSLLGSNQVFSLNDVNENKEYGSCVGTIGDEDNYLCSFNGKDVKGKKEWEKLIKPYMEE